MSVSTTPGVPSAKQPGSGAAAHRSGWHPIGALRVWHRLTGRTHASAPVARPRDNTAEPGMEARLAAADRLLQRAQRDCRPLSIVVFDIHDLPELACLFGPDIARNAMATAAASFRRIAGRAGLVVQIRPTAFALALPDVDRDESLQLVHAEFGKSCCLEVAAGGEEIVLLLDCLTHTVDGESTTLKRVCESLCRDIEHARHKEQTRRMYLERERESHTRPMQLRAARNETVPRASPAKVPQEPYPRIPATIPMPIAG